jgi:hypothetical protein
MRLAATILAGSGLAACGPAVPAPSTPPSNTPTAAAPLSQLDVTAAPEAHWRELLGGPLEAGCVAVDRAGEALCITASGGLQSGTSYELAWLSPTGAEVWDGASVPQLSFDPPKLDTGIEARAVARLVRGGFGVMPAATWGTALAQDKADVATIDDAGAAVRITWTRTHVQHVDGGDGQWEAYHDVAKSELPVACALGEDDIENPSRSEMSAWRLPGGAVLVERDTAWAIEGDHGGDTTAQVIAPGQACPR